MSYTIRTCKDCGQKLHIRQKGKTLYLKNRCVHFSKPTITATQLEEQAIHIDKLLLSAKRLQDFPQLCAIHKIPMNFVQYLRRFTELYYCPRCAIIDKLIPAEYIKKWKRKTYNTKWNPGEVKLIVSPSYETMVKQGMIKT